MTYRYLGAAPPVKTVDADGKICFPESAFLRIQPRAAGVQRELVTLTGRYSARLIPLDRGLLVVDPRYDNLPLGPGWEWRM